MWAPLEPRAVRLPGCADQCRSPRPSADPVTAALQQCGLAEVVGGVEHAVDPPERIGEAVHPRPHRLAGRQSPEESLRCNRYSSPTRRGRARRVGAAGRRRRRRASPLSEFSVEWNDDRVEPSTHSQFQPPSASLVLEEPVDDAVIVGAEPHAVGDGPGVDAAVDLAAPVGQSSYSHRLFSARSSAVRPAQNGGIEAPLAQRVERPRRRGPRLAGTFGGLGAVEVEVAGKKAPPAHCPSGSCSASSRAPKPSVAILARVASQTADGSRTRSRSTCQRSAGSESRNHAVRSVTATPRL